MCDKIGPIRWAMFVFITLSVSESGDIPDVTLISYKNYGNVYHMTCVVNGSTDSAIAWNAPITKDGATNKVSEYIPQRNSEYNCDINSESETCNRYWLQNEWTLGRSLDGILEPVTDSRWEDFKLYYTSGGNEFKYIAYIDKSDFAVHISLRIEKEAHIFLCDNKYPPQGKCYWILLGGFGGNSTAIRKCARENVPAAGYPRSDCRTIRVMINHTADDPILNKMEWRHFTVEKRANNIRLLDVGRDKLILNYFDDGRNHITTNYLSIRSSGGTPGYWKLHNYEYTFTSRQSVTYKELGQSMYVKDTNFCSTMFVAMCSQCILELQVSYWNGYSGRYEAVTTTIIKPKKGMAWQEEKVLVQIPVPSEYVQLFVKSVCLTSNCKNPFWAIDNFQICSEKEVRVLSIDQDGNRASCQIIKHPYWHLGFREVQTDNTPETNCPRGTFGKNCIDCNTVLGRPVCDKSTVCEVQSDRQTTCRCARGYTGTACDQVCPPDLYGVGCKERCGYCMYKPCDFITGNCQTNRCLIGFTDSRCQTPLLPVLLNPPTIIEFGHTYFVAQIQNNAYKGNEKPLYYKIQYKEVSQNQWKETETYFYDYAKPIRIYDLKILTTYTVQAVLLTKNYQAYDKSYVPQTNVTTTCAVIKENDIKIDTSNTSAILIFKNNYESCRSADYKLVLEDGRKITSETFIFNINNLQPARTYYLTITNNMVREELKLDFTTTEGAPESVEKLRVTNQDAASITISWKPPQVTNGKIKYYNIQYKHIKYIACGTEQEMNEGSIASIREESTSTIINNLHPYSEYSIEVVAVTVISGIPSTIKANTSQTDSLEASEIPTIKTIEPQSTEAKIILQQPSCVLIKGPVVYYVNVECSNSWCSQGAENINYTDNNYYIPITLTKLQAYCNYTVKIKVGRRNGNIFNGAEITQSFNTKTSVPHRVIGITAYSKNESSISLRFLPPFPPTGEIEKYFLKYCHSVPRRWSWKTDDICKEQYFSPSKCKFMSNFHCVTLHQLENEKVYKITIQAKNIDSTNYNSPESIEVQTIQDSPRVLENLTCTWDDYYNLTLTWGHPSITNGPLTKFIVHISSEESICYDTSFPISESNYNITYHYVVPFDKCYSSNLSIRASACNIYEGPPATQNVRSPPKTPTFSKIPSVEAATNTTITINVSAPKDLVTNSSMYVIVTTANSATEYTNIVERIPEILKKQNIPNNAFSWVAAEYDFTKSKAVPQMLVIGDGNKSKSTRLNGELHNKILHTATNYTIYFAIINEFGGFVRYSVITIEGSTSGMQSEEQNQSSNYGLLALLLLLILPAIFLIFLRRRKKGSLPWLTMLNMNNNLASNRRNPDVIPLATSIEQKPGKVIPQPQLRPKRIIPSEEDANLSQPSTSALPNEFSKPVKIIEFEDYVKESIKNGELDRQHQLFPRGQTKPWDYGLLPQNKSKNRYNNLVAYDHTRVKLAKINNDPYSDYINANYIEGYNTKKAYIATQGPKAATVNDFWRMIWQEKVNNIIMLANVIEAGKKKTEQYWPNVNEYLEFGNIKVEYVSSRVFADYEYRTFLMYYEKEERKVEQLHFTSWPDHAVPLYSQSLVPFLRKILTIPQGSPIVVHCSAGVGRTGTIILCDLCLRMAAREGIVDVLKHQHNLRQQRANMVDNIEQYKLAHLVLLECLIAPQTSIACDEEMEGSVLHLLESDRVAQQMQYLHETAWQDQAMRPPLKLTPIPEWSTKNRFQDIIPSGYGRVYLSRYPVSDEHSDYINAVEVDGFRSPQRFIVTQQPLPHTISEFWRMIDEKEVATIVSLNKINLGDETSCVFWPTAKVGEIQPVPFLTLQFHNKSSTDHYSIITIYLHNKKDKESTKRAVTLFILKGWPANKLFPDEEESLLKLWEEIERTLRGNNPIVVTCYDGAKACGLFIALSFVVEKMKLEQECDVCLAVRTVRHNRKQFVTEIDQFLYLYRAAIRYLSCFDLYSNFTPAGKK